MAVEKRAFGQTHTGEEVTAYRLDNGRGTAVTLLDYGAAVQSLTVPSRDGVPTDVVLGYDTVAEYERSGGYLGATVGRMCNRVGGAQFALGGKVYRLAKNDGKNHLHGGTAGFDKRMWQVEEKENGVVFSRISPDGEEGYPGNLEVHVTFTLTEEGALCIGYDAVCDRDTIVSLTNHSYFNLAGGGTVLDHTLQVFASRILENDAACLPTGRMLEVEDTPFDFRQAKPIGRDIGCQNEQLRRGGGYDHNFVLAGTRAAELRSLKTGIGLAVDTTLPGMQVYTANALSARPGKGGAAMGPRDAVCLETQLYPNAMACYGFPSPVLRAGRRMRTETTYRFFTF